MKKFKLVQIFFCGLFITISLICFTKSAQGQVITIKVASWHAIGNPMNELLKSFSEELEKRAAGKLSVKFYPAGTLVSTSQQWDATSKGIVDIGHCVPGYTMGRFPFTQVLDFPLGYPEGGEPTLIANEFYEKFKPKEFDAVKVLWFHSQPAGFVFTKSKAVEKLEDLKGLKLRCFGTNAKFVSNIGASPVAMPMSDAYDALAKGVVDGILACHETMHSWKFGELTKYVTENKNSAYAGLFLVMMNKKKFQSLPSDIQALIEKMSKEYSLKFSEMWSTRNMEGRQWFKNRGGKIITLTKEEEAHWYQTGTKPLIDSYIKEMKAAGLPGEQAVLFIQDAIKRYKK